MIGIRKNYMASDANPGPASPAGPAAGGSADIVRTPKLPRKDDDVAAVAAAVADQWAANAGLTLMWMRQLDFAGKVVEYKTVLGRRKTAGSGQQSKTQRLRTLDKTIDSAVSSIKVDIQQKFTRALAEAEYSRYGIVRANGSFRFPKDRDERLAAIQLAADAAGVDGTGGASYGASFWKALHGDYAAALSSSGANDADISTSASAKNKLKEEIIRVMRALMLIIQANYPDSFEAMYRSFGWQKENY